jgi:Ca2+-binding EF-hand superfamily protein
MAATGAVSAYGASSNRVWGGGCPWQSDKTAFKQFCKTAIEVPTSKERKELYGLLAECFLDADADRDGLVSADEFDFLVERAAALPRRFGLAPSWVEHYGTLEARQQARNEMFRQMDADQSGKIGLEEWVQFTLSHISEKVEGLKQKPAAVDFAHLAGVGADDFVNYCERAVSDAASEEYKSLYEHLFKVFVESDVEEAGNVHWANFDRLIDAAAKAPRDCGLAPTTAAAYPTQQHKEAARAAEWNAIDTDQNGSITFDEFLRWAVTHIAAKVEDYRAGRRYQKPCSAPIYGAPVPVVGSSMVVGSVRACPFTGSVGPCPIATSRSPQPTTVYRVLQQ